MKFVIQRHAGDFAVFRTLAIAQAFLDAGHEVWVECLVQHRRALELTPKVKWKDPHHPHFVGERKMKDAAGNEVVRKGGPIYDHLVNLDGDGPFEARWAHLGMSFWTWAKGEARKAALEAGFELPFIPDFPEIPVPAAIQRPPEEGGFVLACVLSEECLPTQINVVELEAFIRAKYPDKKILWSVLSDLNLGEGRETLKAKDYAELTAQLRGAHAVFAVNGMAACLARCQVAGGGPLAPRFWYVLGADEKRQAFRAKVHGKESGAPITPKPDPFAALREKFAALPNTAQGGICAFTAELKLEEKQACPAD